MRRAALLCALLPAAAGAQTADFSDAGLPTPPSVEDPLLTPPPPAPKMLGSWHDALDLVRAQSPDLHTSLDNVSRAEAQVRVALAGVLPGLVAQGSFTHQFITVQQSLGGPPETIPQQDVFGAGGTASWTPLNPRGLYAIGTANRGVDATKADLSEKRRTIAESIAQTLLATLAAERVAELNRVGLRAALERQALAQTKYRFQSGTGLDLDRAAQDVAAARALIVTGDEALLRTREALGLALGSREPLSAPGTLDLVGFEHDVAATCALQADVEARPDVAAAKIRVELAERAVNDVWLQFAPTLSFQSQLAWNNQVLYGPDTTWWLSGVITVPLWDGGARYGFLRDTRAAADQARQALEATRLSALVSIAQATRSVGVSRASRDLAQQQRDLANRVDQRTREGYVHGLGTSLDLITSAQLLRQAEINLVLLQFQASLSRVLATLANADCSF